MVQIPTRLLAVLATGLLTCVVLMLVACRPQSIKKETLALPQGVSLELYEAVRNDLGGSDDKPPAESAILFALAERLRADEEFGAAVACLERVTSDDPERGTEARLQQGLLLVTLHHATEAERNFQEFIALAQAGRKVPGEQVAEALDMLRFLLGVELRFEERHAILRAIHLLNAADTNDAITYCFPSVLRWNGEQAVRWLEEFLAQDPEDFTLRVALGRYRTGQGNLDEAEDVLRRCCIERPDDLRAQAALLACHYERADWEQMEDILADLPPAHPDEPWLLLRLRGHVHNHFGRFQNAADVFTMAITADPANGESHLGLGKALAGLHRDDESKQEFAKTNVIARIQNRLGWIQVRDDDVSALMEVAELCEEIDLDVRAGVIARRILQLSPQHEGAQGLLSRLAASQ
ncbi:MAG: tetratricopeptide repeat protein [Planctomycetaceae bacterium]|nr:tetratricopeptide repeat protein [Planctomycetales bacterium]MCB9875276.1 tetratricopeptide repeat protein [Planctomycetaceae bacterium]MCB9938940.1 tetratricopeptide repeat protein [Planctomycetaceae bacterium]